jgi:acyl-CoA dehydrogenase
MNLTFSDADNAFRDEVRAFLDENLTPDLIIAADRTIETFAEFAPGRRWLQALARRGWGQPGWPVEWGGTGWSTVQHYLFKRETALAGVPYGFNNHPGSCILKFGTEEQKQRFLPPILNVETIWAQGYSEPQAGSDLASLKTSALPDGDDYVVNGTKIWTTYAHHADWLFALVRTSSEGPKQRGITFLLIDLDTPGVDVKPIRNLAGVHDFNQVFFTDARVPQANRIGPENEGWTVAKHFLAFEHMGGGAARLKRRLAKLERIAELEPGNGSNPLAEDPDFSRKIAELCVAIDAVDFFELRLMTALSQGQAPGFEGSAAKIRSGRTMQALTELGMQAMAYYGLPYQPEALTIAYTGETVAPEHGMTETLRYFMKRGETIYGGCDEVQHDILAKRVLGL